MRAKSTSDQVLPVVVPVACKGAQNISDDAIDTLDLAGSVVVELVVL